MTGMLTIYLTIISCKKDSTSANSPVSIVGKWTVEKNIVWTTSGGSTTKETVDFTGTDSYEDFRADGHAYEKYFDFASSAYIYDTATYVVSGPDITTHDKYGITTTSELQDMTEHSVTMYTVVSHNGTIKHWLYLKK
jgi:hypothetical protein